MTQRLKAVYVLLGITPWALWYAAILGIKAIARAGKDPSLYTGTCYKPNGYAVQCSLDAWLVWDATPYVEIFTLVGGIAAAAVTGWVFLKYMALDSRSSAK